MVEVKLRRCTRCKKIGHNKSTCKGGEVGKNPKGYRPRTQVDATDFTCTDPSQPSTSRGKEKRVRKAAVSKSKISQTVSQTVTHPQFGCVQQTITQTVQPIGKAKKSKKN